MLGMLKAAEEQRKAAQIAWGKKKGHLSKGFQTPKSEKIKYADEVKDIKEDVNNAVEAWVTKRNPTTE